MQTVGKKAREAIGCLRNGIGPRDADDVETLLARSLRERSLQRRWLAQKSRSA
jgi:hypothetical protein